MSRTMISLVLAAASVAVAGSANAALLAYEGFGADSSGFAQAFPVAGGSNTAPALSYGGLATQGGSRQGGGAGTGAYNLLSTPVTSGTVWMSWLYKTAPTPAAWNRLVTFTGTDPYDHAGTPTIHNERYNLGYIDSWFGIRGTYGTTHPNGVWTTPQAADTTYMLVAKYEFGAAGGADDGKITLWVSPDTSSLGTGLTPTGGHEIVTSGVVSDDAMSFAGIAFEASGSQFDEVRLGESWIDVSPMVPEPGTAAVVAGVAMLAIGRRRH